MSVFANACPRSEPTRGSDSFTSSISTSFSTPMLVTVSGPRSRQEWRSRSSATILSSLMVRKPDCTGTVNALPILRYKAFGGTQVPKSVRNRWKTLESHRCLSH